MKRAALVGLIALLPFFNGYAAETPGDASISPRPDVPSPDGLAALENKALPFEQPALWIPGARSRTDAGRLPPSLDTDRGRLLLGETGLYYLERVENRSSELLAIPYARIVSVSTELSEHGTALLFVTEASGPAGSARPHLFVILPAGPVDAGVFATRAQALIANRIPAKTGVVDGVMREEKVAVSTAHWPPTIVFGEPEPLQSGNPDRFAESLRAGTAAGAIPFVVCLRALCPPPALAVTAVMVGVGAAAGAVVGIGREIVAKFEKAPPQPPAFSPQEIRATSPVLAAAAIESLGQSAFQACVLRKIASGGETKEPLRWSGDGRIATLSPAADASRDGHQYAVDTFLSKVVLVPAGTPGQEAADVPARLVVEAGLRFHDLKSGTIQEAAAEWRAEPRTLRVWADDDGALLKKALGEGCDALAGQLLAEAERVWAQPLPIGQTGR